MGYSSSFFSTEKLTESFWNTEKFASKHLSDVVWYSTNKSNYYNFNEQYNKKIQTNKQKYISFLLWFSRPTNITMFQQKNVLNIFNQKESTKKSVDNVLDSQF